MPEAARKLCPWASGMVWFCCEATVFFADVVDGADVGMVEGGGGFGFPAEAGESLRIFADIGRKEFEGDEAVEAGILGFGDDATELFRGCVSGM